MLHGLDLFSGIAGNTLALREWVKTIAYCERDAYARSVLLSRMGDGSIDVAPIWDDVTTLRGDMFNVPIDIIVGGFPCQDISCAGRGVGLEGKRSGLFFEIVRLAKEIKPSFLFLENVGAIRTRGLDTVGRELADAGYDCRWGALSAYDVGAPHKRERWFCLARNTHCDREPRLPVDAKVAVMSCDVTDSDSSVSRLQQAHSNIENTAIIRDNGPKRSLADAEVIRLETERISSGTGQELSISRRSCVPGDWTVEPSIRRVVNGLPNRVDRLRCLGNAVVPFQAREAFMRLMGC